MRDSSMFYFNISINWLALGAFGWSPRYWAAFHAITFQMGFYESVSMRKIADKIEYSPATRAPCV